VDSLDNLLPLYWSKSPPTQSEAAVYDDKIVLNFLDHNLFGLYRSNPTATEYVVRGMVTVVNHWRQRHLRPIFLRNSGPNPAFLGQMKLLGQERSVKLLTTTP